MSYRCYIMIFHHFYFRYGFKFQYSVCNGCHDPVVLCPTISDVAIFTVKGVDYRSIIHNSKSETIHLLENSVLKIMSIYKMHINNPANIYLFKVNNRNTSIYLYY